MFDQPDSQHRGRAKHARKNTARREQERDNRSAIKHRSAEQPLSNESNQGRTEQAFEDSKNKENPASSRHRWRMATHTESLE